MNCQGARLVDLPVGVVQGLETLADIGKARREGLVFFRCQRVKMVDHLIDPCKGPHGAGADELHAKRNIAIQGVFQFGHDFKCLVVGI
jgi:hypothetical protein